MRKVERYLKSPDSSVKPEDRNNLRFYVAMHAVTVVGNLSGPGAVAGFDIDQLDGTRIQDSVDYVGQKYTQHGGNDQVAKGPDLLGAVLAGNG